MIGHKQNITHQYTTRPSLHSLHIHMYTWIRQSGRDSNITMTTPMGTVCWVSTKSLPTKVFLTVLLTWSLLLTAAANCFSPSASVSSFSLVSTRRDRRAGLREEAMLTSIMLALSMSDSRLRTSSASLSRMWALWAEERESNAELPDLAREIETWRIRYNSD